MSYRDLAASIGREPFSWVEIDLDFCSERFGVAPCTAVLLGPGLQCFNTFMSCQDRTHYNPAPRTYRFIEPRFAGLGLPGEPPSVQYLYIIHADTAGGDKYSQTYAVVNNLEVPGNHNVLSWTFGGTATAFHVYRQKADPTVGASGDDFQLIATLSGATFDFTDSNAADDGAMGGPFTDEPGFVLDVDVEHDVLPNNYYFVVAKTSFGDEISNAINLPNELTRPGAHNTLNWVWSFPASAFWIYRDQGDSYRRIAIVPGSQRRYTDANAPPGIVGTGGAPTEGFTLTGNSSVVALDSFYYPCVESVRLSPTKIEPGKALGRRASITVDLQDFELHDLGMDPYVFSRTTATRAVAGFLSRLFARQRISLLNRPLRVIQSFVEDPSQRETRYYLIEKVDGPDDRGRIRITAKDTLKFTDNDRSQAPRPTTGVLSANTTVGSTTFTLLPTGIGDLQYAAEGWVRIDDEIISYTRAGDVFTIVGRRQLGTAGNTDEHDGGSTAQQVLRYENKYVHEIVYDLMVNYADVSPAKINFAAWEDEVLTYMPTQYTATIASPTGVRDLIDELSSQAPFNSWWDERKATVRLAVLRLPDSNTPVLNDQEHLIADSVKIAEKIEMRTSQVWIYYKQRDPTQGLSQTANWSVLRVEADVEGESTVSYGAPAVKVVYARFINDDSGAVGAQQQILGRFKVAPREIQFTLDPKDGELWTGDLLYILTRGLLDQNGRASPVLFQVTEANEDPPGERLKYTALEYYAPALGGDGFDELHITEDTTTFNAYDFYIAERGVPDAGTPLKVRFILDAGVHLHGYPATKPHYPESIYNPPPDVPGTPGTPAFSTGTGWPLGTTLQLVNLGRIIGFGGYGGEGNHLRDIPAPGGAGYPNDYTFLWGMVRAHEGGTAIFAEHPLAIDNLNGEVWGGGGGGEGGPCVWSNAGQDDGPSNCKPFDGSGGGGCGSGGGGGAGSASEGGAGGYVGIGDTGDLDIQVEGSDGSAGSETEGGAGGVALDWAYAGAAGGGPGEPGEEVPLPAPTSDCEKTHRGYGPGAAGFAAYGPVTFVNLGDCRGPFHS